MLPSFQRVSQVGYFEIERYSLLLSVNSSTSQITVTRLLFANPFFVINVNNVVNNFRPTALIAFNDLKLSTMKLLYIQFQILSSSISCKSLCFTGLSYK